MTAEPLTTGTPVRAPRAPHAPRPSRTTPPRRRPTRPGAAPSRARVTALPASRTHAPRTPFVLLVVALLGFGLLALLLLNTASAQDAFRLSDLQRQSKALADQEQSLTQQAANLGNPASVAAAAGKLGMVPGAVPIFLGPGQKAPAGEIIGGMMLVVPAPRSTAPAKPTATQPSKATQPATSTKVTQPKKPATTKKSPTAADVTTAMRNFAAFQRYANAVKAAQRAGKGTTSTGTHP